MNAPELEGRGRRLPWLYALALVPLAYFAWRFAWTNDDAYISFTYARSIAAGAGFVHHPSAPPVEGTTELLWTLASALVLKLGAPLEASMNVVSFLCAVLLAVSVVRATTQLPTALRATAAVGAGASVPLAVWATSGMGVAPFALCVFWLWRCVESPERLRARRIAVAASLCVLLRADGAWWVLWILGPALLSFCRDPAARRPLLIGALVALGVQLGLTVWRLAIFGDWLPNTARAKLGFGARATERGLDYVVHFVATHPGFGLFAVLGLVAATTSGAARRALVVASATALHAVLVGGDFMAFGRFLLPALPFLVVAAALGIGRLRGAAQLIGVGLALAGAVVNALPAFGVHATPTAWREAHRFRFNPGPGGAPQPFVDELTQWRNMCRRVDEWSATGRDLARLTPPEATFVAGAVGALGYFSERRVFDRHGLLSPEVAQLAPSVERRSPGHDRVAPPEFFARWNPTFDEVGLWPAAWLERHPKGPGVVVLGPSEVEGLVLWGLPGPGYARDR